VLLFDDGERLVQVMPREVAEVLGTLDNRRWRIHERRADEWRRCLDRIEALVDLRGVVPFADAVRECELCVEGNADGDLLMRYLVDEPWAASTDVTVDLLGDDIFLVFPDLYDIFGDDDDGLFMEEFCLDLPRYKRPRKIIFANVIRNATGKIDKPKLREIYCGLHIVEEQNQS
jgi:acyl-CoA synthetase (AMP-forming)/AMP-acid ligase II